MIWSIVSRKEMENYGTVPVFRFYQEALGKENISLAVIEENDPLDFINPDDIVLLRTAHSSIIERIKVKKVRTTAEDFEIYQLVADKIMVNDILREYGINVPLRFNLDEINKEETYFVKPRFGSDSFGITKECVCHSPEAVLRQTKEIEKNVGEPLIEEFIDGIDCSVALSNVNGKIYAAAIYIDCKDSDTIQTQECKAEFKGFCSPVKAQAEREIKFISQKVFGILNIKHHARIDFRMDKLGRLYVIDINLIPGLSPIGHFVKCFSLCENKSYHDALMMVINSAS